MSGFVESLHVSNGGVPKHAVPRARVTSSGMEGDRQRDRRHHGGPDRALCLYSAELIEALRAEGHPIRPGDAGENVTLRGVDWSAMQVGVRFRVGTVEGEITGFTTPCRNLEPFFLGADFTRISHKLHPGWSRVYARILKDGEIETGARFELQSETLAAQTASNDLATLRTARDKALEERNEENESLRVVARKMSEVADVRELLGVLCESAMGLCRGHGAAVLRTTEGEAQIVAAVGIMKQVEDLKFPLADSLAERAIAGRDVVTVEHFARSGLPRSELLGHPPAGPVLMAPLIAHDRVLGALSVMRDAESIPFDAREVQRLRVMADHSALALWKEQLYEQAQAADAAKGRFLATISHELRTPLTALIGYEELLADRVTGDLSEAQVDVLARMKAVTEHLASMIEEVLSYSSLEGGREVVRPTEFLADDLVVAAAALVEPTARRKQVAVICEAAAEPIRMTSDVDKARQILVNLSGNAVKFTDQGEVRLSVLRVGDEVRFAVRDTGIGIAAADLATLFEPFVQVETGLTRRYGGTGLGLYISRQLARMLGGRVEVQSEPGVGSTFTLVLPLEPVG